MEDTKTQQQDTPQTTEAPATAPASAEDAKTEVAAKAPAASKPAAARPTSNRPSRGRGGMNNRRGPGGGGRGRGPRRRKDEFEVKSEYDEKTLEIARVTRVTKGGKRMRFRSLSVIGNRKGRVGFGLGKSVDVPGSTGKAAAQARKSLVTVPIKNETIPHAVRAEFGAAKVVLKPAPKGTGIKAGGPVRVVLELAGIGNVTAKILGSKSKINNVKAVFKALTSLRMPPESAKKTSEPAKKEAAKK